MSEPGKKIRVLLLEDRVADAKLILFELGRAGFDLDWHRVQTEREYTQQLDGHLDAILADFKLPTFDALTALRLLRERGLDIPFILVSGTIGEEVAVEAMRLGADDYVLKDRPARLGPALRRVLEEKRVRDERKRAEQALTESEERYRLLVEGSPDAILIHCEGTIQFANSAAAQLIGAAQPSELLGKPLIEIVHPDYRAIVQERVQQIIQQNQTPGMEQKILRLDGNVVDVEVVGIPFVFQGKPAVQSILRDLTERKRAQAALTASEGERRLADEKLRHILTHSPAVIYTVRIIAGNFAPVVVSDNIQDLSGFTAGECAPTDWWLGNLHPDDRARVQAGVSEGLRSEGYSMEYRIRHKNGTFRWVQDNNRVVRDASGRPIEAVGVWTDITQRKKAELDLAERTHLTALAAAIGAALTVSESFPLALQGCTDSILAHFDAGLARIWTLNEAEKVLELQASSGEKGEGEERYNRVPIGQMMIGLIARERRCHWTNALPEDPHFTSRRWAIDQGLVAFAGYPLIVQDQLVGVMALFARQPLTSFVIEGLAALASQIAIAIREMRAQQSLRQSEERYRDLFENAHDLILAISEDGRFLYVNRAWRDTLGYAEEELAGLRLPDLAPPDRQADCAALLRRVLAGEQLTLTEMEFVSKEGKRIAVEGSINRKVENGKTLSIRAILRDVTEKRQWEAQILRNQRMESIGTLAGGIAHDLNNALAPIVMSLELLRSNFTDPESLVILDTLATSAQRGAEMVRQILTFSRGLEDPRAEVQIRHVISEMQKIIKQAFPKRLQFRTALARDLWTVNGDATQLHQVLLNLCVNARDAMPTDGTLSIKAENVVLDENAALAIPESKPGPFVVIRVSDTGTGIPPEIQKRIFDPFFTTKPASQGTGLGLSIVRGIVTSHGGFISFKTELGKGCEFSVYLPAHAASHASVQAKTSDLPAGRGELILVVDDEAAVRTIAEQTLVMFGYHVVTANDGVQAIGVCAQYQARLDLVLMDGVMPVMDGAAAIRAIRSSLPQMKIISASGLPFDGPGTDQHLFQPNAFLPKPYTADQLLTRIREVLDETRSVE